MQAIYYPGLTRARIAEPAASLALLLLAFLTPAGTTAFGLTLAMQAIFWLRTQPVNRIWVKGLDLGRADAAFFRTGQAADEAADWTVVRDRWEQSHVARAACAAVAFLLLAIAVAF